MTRFKPEVEVKREAWDEDTIMVTRKMSPHTHQSMVWAMTRDELVDLHAKIGTYLEENP